MNSSVLIGRLSRGPELKFLPGSGTAVCKFNLAVDRDLSKEKKQELESKGQQTADFINITVFGKIAESCANFLAKGRLVAIQGRISTGNYTKDDGTKVYTTEVIAERVQFLEWGDKQQNNTSNSDSIDTTGFKPVDDDDIPF